MISLHEARQIICGSISTLPAVKLPLSRASGRILASPALSNEFFPFGDCSMMDGYVIHLEDPPGQFQVVDEIQPGEIVRRPLHRGECMRIFTGALLPDNGGRVVIQEDVKRTGDVVTIQDFPEQIFVRKKGSEAVPGDVILPSGTRLNSAELAILAQIGITELEVIPAPSIRHIATGGEIVAPEETPKPGQIRDSNSTLLAALFASIGVKSFASQRCVDNLEALVELGNQACNLLVISGGASVGKYDFGREALRRLGFTIHFDQVNLRPGKPLIFATRDRQAAFVVPGNPISHFVCFHVALRLAVEQLSGMRSAWEFLRLEIRDGEPLRMHPRETYWPARISAERGRLVATPKRWSTSGDLFSLTGVNALIRVNASSPCDGQADALLLDVSILS